MKRERFPIPGVGGDLVRHTGLGLADVIAFIIVTLIWGSTWVVIRGQLGVVAPQWSVGYRFAIAAIAMAFVALFKGEDLRLDRNGMAAAGFLGVAQFCMNFNFVYLAERHVTSGLVATVFALLLIPNTLLAWAFLGHRPSIRFLISSAIAVAGITLLSIHELGASPARASQVLVGLALTLVALISASSANVFQAQAWVRRHPLFTLMAWGMVFGAMLDMLIAFAVAGPPRFDPRPSYWAGLVYLALPASTLTFSLYFPLIRRMGPAKAAYSSVLVPIIAMSFSTWLEHYRWTPTAAAGAFLALAGMLGALSRSRSPVPAPDAG